MYVLWYHHKLKVIRAVHSFPTYKTWPTVVQKEVNIRACITLLYKHVCLMLVFLDCFREKYRSFLLYWFLFLFKKYFKDLINCLISIVNLNLVVSWQDNRHNNVLKIYRRLTVRKVWAQLCFNNFTLHCFVFISLFFPWTRKPQLSFSLHNTFCAMLVWSNGCSKSSKRPLTGSVSANNRWNCSIF